MIETITAVNDAVNHFIWGIPAMISIIGVGLLLSVRTRFLQIRKFPYAIKTTIGRMFRKKDATDGAMTPFQAVCTALAATVGTGNIAGVAGAIAIGGPGAVFWMWCSALLGMCTKFSEVTLAVHFRERNKNGELVGGPMYYIRDGLHAPWLAFLCSIFMVVQIIGGNFIQSNTIGGVVEDTFQIPPIYTGAILTVLIFAISAGGLKRFAHVARKVVPFMATLYIASGLLIILINIKQLPGVFADIFAGAFGLRAVSGGVLGSMIIAMQKGIARGLYSNEAGEGSAPVLPSAADGTIAQQTEKLVGPYELHDFYLYYVLRFGFGPAKIYHLALAAFAGRYEPEVLLAWLRNFYRRFFAQQFKRSCLPDGPKVGSVTLSPRADWRMPSDACNALWLKELDEIEAK